MRRHGHKPVAELKGEKTMSANHMKGLPHRREKKALKQMSINIYEDEKPILKQEANALGLTVGEYIRYLIQKEREERKWKF